MNHVMIFALLLILLGVLVSIGVIYFGRKNNTVKSQMLMSEFMRAADTKGLIINRMEVFSTRIIGIDSRRRAIVYVRYNRNAYWTSYAYLDYCENFKIERNHNELLLTFDMKNSTVMDLLFHSEIEDGMEKLQTNERIAEYWLEHILSMS